MTKKKLIDKTRNDWGLDKPQTFAEMTARWESKKFTPPAEEPDDDPIIQKHKPAGQWKSGVSQPRSFWSGL
jgi:hypothetical protein